MLERAGRKARDEVWTEEEVLERAVSLGRKARDDRWRCRGRLLLWHWTCKLGCNAMSAQCHFGHPTVLYTSVRVISLEREPLLQPHSSVIQMPEWGFILRSNFSSRFLAPSGFHQLPNAITLTYTA